MPDPKRSPSPGSLAELGFDSHRRRVEDYCEEETCSYRQDKDGLLYNMTINNQFWGCDLNQACLLPPLRRGRRSCGKPNGQRLSSGPPDSWRDNWKYPLTG